MVLFRQGLQGALEDGFRFREGDFSEEKVLLRLLEVFHVEEEVEVRGPDVKGGVVLLGQDFEYVFDVLVFVRSFVNVDQLKIDLPSIIDL